MKRNKKYILIASIISTFYTVSKINQFRYKRNKFVNLKKIYNVKHIVMN